MRISWHSSSIIHTRQDSYVPIFYFELAKRYGDIPLITTLLSEEEANMQKRTSFDEVIQFIVDECDAIAPHLPISYKELIKSETGRATRGAAMALKSRALLYSASPLFNKSGNIDKWEVCCTCRCRCHRKSLGFRLHAVTGFMESLE